METSSLITEMFLLSKPSANLNVRVSYQFIQDSETACGLHKKIFDAEVQLKEL